MFPPPYSTIILCIALPTNAFILFSGLISSLLHTHTYSFSRSTMATGKRTRNHFRQIKSSSSMFLSFFFTIRVIIILLRQSITTNIRNTLTVFQSKKQIEERSVERAYDNLSKRPLIPRSSYNWSSSKYVAGPSRSISGFHFPPFTVLLCPQLSSAAFVGSFDDSTASFVGLSLSPSFLSFSR